ncbi:hypothetical protein [Mycolicibacterium fallax]|uniref:Uncharacterized protein n=1 Tax=Mycolicibacterium fallax TaxID=1793 RepID=A0A1X1RNB3_MYCFA|nr:hypothetical protein [Mycolicibacterium fallax]ORV10165.1 hypothetical protein AWC04_00925 [Mycolicibacterium fallax]BBY99041.1 hypothetical protein MFAL_25080 [Mycolicibacterium fallax]HOW94071.1 hypothetical protein [Mycolicibacterium fallax]
MRNLWRLLAFDLAAPALILAALAGIGVVLDWPTWWVSVASMLGLLVVQGVLVNLYLLRRDGVSVGTDDDAPGLRLAVAGVAAGAAVAAALVAHTHWTVADRTFEADRAAVVSVATEVAEATATFSPAEPTAGIERAAALMVPGSATAFRDNFGRSTADLAKRRITAQAQTVSAGLESLAPDGATAVVVMRTSQTAPGKSASRAVVGLRLSLQPSAEGWRVVDIAPLQRVDG